jgi:c(7)-type cytochrome triheme protein
MQMLVTILIGLLIGLAGDVVLGQEKKAPSTLTFKAKPGNVVFDHSKHVKSAKNDCKTCHDKLWPQLATAPLNFKAAMHKTAEAKHTSCGFCHHPGGGAFESKGNCNKCHQKATAKG